MHFSKFYDFIRNHGGRQPVHCTESSFILFDLNSASFYLISFVRGFYKETKVDDKVLFNETVHLMLSLPWDIIVFFYTQVDINLPSPQAAAYYAIVRVVSLAS